MRSVYNLLVTAVVLLFLIVTAAFSQSSSPSPAGTPTASPIYQRPEKSERVHEYLKNMFGYSALAKNIASAGISTWSNAPDEWGPHWSGFGKRLASNTGKSIIKNTTAFSLEEAFKIDSRYVRADGRSAGYKIRNALTSPFIARDRNGKKIFGYPRVAGQFASSIIAVKAWYPSHDSWKDGMRNGAVSMGTSALFNLITEFVLKK